MKLMDLSGTEHLLGTFGGRYKGGISCPPSLRGHRADRDLAADVLRAARKKLRKIERIYKAVEELDLVIYANSNADRLSYCNSAMPLLQKHLARWSSHFFKQQKLAKIAVLKEQKLLLLDRRGRNQVFDLRKSL